MTADDWGDFGTHSHWESDIPSLDTRVIEHEGKKRLLLHECQRIDKLAGDATNPFTGAEQAPPQTEMLMLGLWGTPPRTLGQCGWSGGGFRGRGLGFVDGAS